MDTVGIGARCSAYIAVPPYEDGDAGNGETISLSGVITAYILRAVQVSSSSWHYSPPVAGGGSACDAILGRWGAIYGSLT